MGSVNRVFKVNGKPFFPVGGQARNSSGYNDAESETAFRAIKALNGNTLEIPVYWEQVEPVEGLFDFASVDSLLASARRHGVKLILLWFASWKNGDMDYAPSWVKTNPARFKRATAPSGKTIWDLSPHCSANVEADSRAFAAFCGHLKATDTGEQTVIAIQIQNEPGLLGSDRDYGPEGEAEFRRPVPAEMTARMKAAGRGPVYDLWQQAGGVEAGSWPEVFGWSGGEMLSAWSIARYIDRIAAYGKAHFDVPMFVNVWLGEEKWRVPGDNYPSGGAVTKVLDIYKWFAPHLDIIAPDIYVYPPRLYDALCEAYSRPDNPLFVPESAAAGPNTLLMFQAIGRYDAVGYCCFAVERLITPDGALTPDAEPIAASFRCISAAIPLLMAHQGTGKIYPVVQGENAPYEYLDLDGYIGMVQYENVATRSANKDWRHPPKQIQAVESVGPARGRGFIVQASRHEFYLVGAAYRLVLRPKYPPEQSIDTTLTNEWLMPRLRNWVSVDEGHFDDEGAFVVDRRRNGDETDGGLWVEPDTGVVRAILTD